MAKKNDWMQNKWRPMMGWVYMTTCITDFILFPVLWSILQAYQGGAVTTPWNPLTLQGAGLFHLAMGAVLGVAAWSRGQEKLAGVAVNPVSYNQGYPYGAQHQSSYEQEYTTVRQYPINTGRTFVSKHGKVGPVIEEQEL